jgi:hypothetical protein
MSIDSQQCCVIQQEAFMCESNPRAKLKESCNMKDPESATFNGNHLFDANACSLLVMHNFNCCLFGWRK